MIMMMSRKGRKVMFARCYVQKQSQACW